MYANTMPNPHRLLPKFYQHLPGSYCIWSPNFTHNHKFLFVLPRRLKILLQPAFGGGNYPQNILTGCIKGKRVAFADLLMCMALCHQAIYSIHQ